jgi:hypothetical protein
VVVRKAKTMIYTFPSIEMLKEGFIQHGGNKQNSAAWLCQFDALNGVSPSCSLAHDFSDTTLLINRDPVIIEKIDGPKLTLSCRHGANGMDPSLMQQGQVPRLWVTLNRRLNR